MVYEISVTAFIFERGGHSYVYVVWPDWHGDHIDGICDAILAHATDDEVELTLDDAWVLMKSVRENAEYERDSEDQAGGIL